MHGWPCSLFLWISISLVPCCFAPPLASNTAPYTVPHDLLSLQTQRLFPSPHFPHGSALFPMEYPEASVFTDTEIYTAVSTTSSSPQDSLCSPTSAILLHPIGFSSLLFLGDFNFQAFKCFVLFWMHSYVNSLFCSSNFSSASLSSFQLPAVHRHLNNSAYMTPTSILIGGHCAEP